MASVGTSWKRGDGVVTAQAGVDGTGGGVGATLKYEWIVAWRLGAEGETTGGPTRPAREFDGDDQEIAKAARVGDPCTVTVSPDGTLRLFCPTEVYAVDNC